MTFLDRLPCAEMLRCNEWTMWEASPRQCVFVFSKSFVLLPYVCTYICLGRVLVCLTFVPGARRTTVVTDWDTHVVSRGLQCEFASPFARLETCVEEVKLVRGMICSLDAVYDINNTAWLICFWMVGFLHPESAYFHSCIPAISIVYLGHGVVFWVLVALYLPI